MRNIKTDNIKYRLRISTKRQRAQTTKYLLRPTSKPSRYYRVSSFNAVKSRRVRNNQETETVNEIPQEVRLLVNEIQYRRQTAFERQQLRIEEYWLNRAEYRLNQARAYGRPTLPYPERFEEFDC